MRITWLGHACFKLENEAGKALVFDPYDSDATGYPPLRVKADAVCVSHGHRDHAFTEAVEGEYSLFDKEGDYKAAGFAIRALSSFHDEAMGQKRGKNLVFVADSDSISVCHLGDIGHIPDSKLAAEIGSPDVLLIPVGGVYTVDAEGARDIVRVLNPKIVVPMHFETGFTKYGLASAQPFIDLMSRDGYAVSITHSSSFEILPSDMPRREKVIELDYA